MATSFVACTMNPAASIPACRAALFDEIVTPGSTVSMAIGLAKAPASFPLPIALVKRPAATATMPGTVESAKGVNNAV
jgi:hypothetical protein